MSQNLSLYQDQARVHKRIVWFDDDTALLKGQPVGKVTDLVTTDDDETAADAWGKRDKAVGTPTASKNATGGRFAGVTLQAYPAVTGGQWIEIAEPGSTVLARCQVNTVVGSGTVMNWDYGVSNGSSLDSDTLADGIFQDDATTEGAGAALALQTKTNTGLTATDRDDDEDMLVLVYLMTGVDVAASS